MECVGVDCQVHHNDFSQPIEEDNDEKDNWDKCTIEWAVHMVAFDEEGVGHETNI